MPVSLHGRADSSRLDIRRVVPDARDVVRPDELRHAVKEAIIRHHRVRTFRGGPTKQSAYPNRGQDMAQFTFIQINPSGYLNFLVVDVDQEDAAVRLMHPSLPEPHWIIENPENGHAQAGWMIEPVRLGPEARPHPVRYAQEVQRALDLLSGNDTAFTRFLVRNPAAHTPAGDVRFGKRHAPYSLGELMRHMQAYRDPFDEEFAAWPTAPAFAGSIRALTPDTTGRNNAIFYRTRSELWRRYGITGRLPGADESLDFALSLNATIPAPLPHREVAELAASAVRQIARGKGRGGSGGTNGWLATKGRKGGKSTTGPKRAAAALNARKGTEARKEQAGSNTDRAAALRTLGRSLLEIAQVLGRSIRTVQRYLAREPKNSDITQATGSKAVDARTSAGPSDGRASHSPALRHTLHCIPRRSPGPGSRQLLPHRPAKTAQQRPRRRSPGVAPPDAAP
jgi:hypothetical protein